MRTCSVLSILCLLGAVTLAGAAGPPTSLGNEDIFSKQKVVEMMRKVHAYQLAHPYTEHDRNWIRATYYTGVMALYETTKDPKILDQVVRWAEKHEWAEGDERERANKKTCGQTYLELYFLAPDPKKIEKIRAYVDSRIETVRAGELPTKGWYYCDTLYVGPPTIAMLGKATGESKYYDYLNEVYWAVTDLLYDTQHQLFYRDSNYFDAASPNGRKVFWSRGNGWVLGGLPRILQYLPEENEHYQRYVDLFQTMSASIAKRQGSDGLWRSNLDDPNDCPNPETSGTAFFCYALGWGINSGLLDRDEYLPVVMRAWGGLCRHLHVDGKLGFVQPVGGDPKPATAEMTHEYAMGLFLLAGKEMVKLLESGMLTDGQLEEYQRECRDLAQHDRWSTISRWPNTVEVVPMRLSDRFKRLAAPETGRAAIQLTSGDAFCYPLYYFIPTFTKDAKYLIYHRAENGEVQLHRLNLRNGESVQLTHGDTPETRWKNWCVESGRGVLDHRSVLNVARGEVVYFTGPLGNEARIVEVETLNDRPLFTLADDREAVGQNCATPDGKWLVYIESPRGSMYRKPVKDAKVVGYNFDTGERRELCEIGCHIHHVLPYDNEHFIFCHPPNGLGMLMTDLDSGSYEYLRAGDVGVPVPAGDDSTAGHVCHFVATRRGIMYEVVGLQGKGQGQRSGLYDPMARVRFEFLIPEDFGYTHTGWDPEGLLWFWEDAARGHRLTAMEQLDPQTGGRFHDLTGSWPTYGGGQKSHFHPQITPDRKWILFTGGDPATETNHIYLLDATDLRPVEGISQEMLSGSGAHDMVRKRPRPQLLRNRIPVKSVAASDFKPGFEPENTIDGDLATLWAVEGDGQWIQYDLGEVASVDRVFIAWHAGNQRREQFEIAVSDNGDQWKVVFNGSSSGTAPGPERCGTAPFRARYVRITGHGNTANSWNSMGEMFLLDK